MVELLKGQEKWLQAKVVALLLLNLCKKGRLNRTRNMTTMRPRFDPWSLSRDDDAAEVRSLVSQPRPLSRLQKRAPAIMQLKRQSPDSMGLCCRSPIPLLSPILVSPLGRGDLETLMLIEDAGKQNTADEEESVVNVVIPANGWQHPAEPFIGERVCSFSNCFVELCVQDRCCS